MRSSYDRTIFPNPNIYESNINSSRNFFGNSSKLENLQNLYFSLNPYSKSTSINSNQQLRLLNQLKSEDEENELDKKYGKPIINNYKRFHLKAEEIQKGKGKSTNKNEIYTNYTPEAKNNPNLAFYSLGDLSSLHPLTYQKLKSSERYLTSGNLKNYTRLQMVDEKIKKLEEKNEYLQTINNIFFDSLKDTLTISLKRKAFLRKHLKDIEYLKQINIDEYNSKVKYLMDLIENGEIDFDNYNFEGEPLNGMENMAGRLEALKTEIGTMLTKNTMKNDINLNFLKQDVMEIKDELEKKLMEFSENNNKNYEILKEYLYREEKDRLEEKRNRKRNIKRPGENYIQDMGVNFEIKGIKTQIAKKKEEKSSEEEIEVSEVSTETNKNIDVIDKLLLDSISVSMTTNGKDVKDKDKKTSTKSKKTRKSEKSNKDENTIEEKEIELTSSSKNTKKKSKNSKWKLLQDSKESDINSKEKETDINNKEIKEEDEDKENNIIEGSYKSKFDSNKPEFISKSKRSKKSKRFRISKETTENKEENIKTESKKESSEIDNKTPDNNKISTENKEEEENEDEDEDDKVLGTESSSVTTESFKLTNRSNKVNLNNIKEHQEVLLGSESSKIKSSNDKKSKKSKKSKRKSLASKNIKESIKEEED